MRRGIYSKLVALVVSGQFFSFAPQMVYATDALVSVSTNGQMPVENGASHQSAQNLVDNKNVALASSIQAIPVIPSFSGERFVIQTKSASGNIGVYLRRPNVSTSETLVLRNLDRGGAEIAAIPLANYLPTGGSPARAYDYRGIKISPDGNQIGIRLETNFQSDVSSKTQHSEHNYLLINDRGIVTFDLRKAVGGNVYVNDQDRNAPIVLTDTSLRISYFRTIREVGSNNAVRYTLSGQVTETFDTTLTGRLQRALDTNRDGQILAAEAHLALTRATHAVGGDTSGDFNLDGITSALDVILLVNHINAVLPAQEKRNLATLQIADSNLDGIFDAGEIRGLLQGIADRIGSSAVGSPAHDIDGNGKIDRNDLTTAAALGQTVLTSEDRARLGSMEVRQVLRRDGRNRVEAANFFNPTTGTFLQSATYQYHGVSNAVKKIEYRDASGKIIRVEKYDKDGNLL